MGSFINSGSIYSNGFFIGTSVLCAVEYQLSHFALAVMKTLEYPSTEVMLLQIQLIF